MNFTTIILAAGKGTRMKSKLPKVLHKVCGKPMLEHVIEAARGAGSEREVVAIGSGADEVRERIQGVEFALQAEQLGTGHAVMVTKDTLKNVSGTVMVLCGDTPLITSNTLKSLVELHRKQANGVTVLSAKLDDPTGYGRIIRDASGSFVKIVEQKDGTPEELMCNEINSGMYIFNSEALSQSLERLTNDNAAGEYYLTDTIAMIKKIGLN